MENKQEFEKKIDKIISDWDNLSFCENNKLNKENQILNCQILIQKGLPYQDKENISCKQKNIAESLLEDYESYENYTLELEKSFSNLEEIDSFSNLISKCAILDISVEKVKRVKEIIKAYTEGLYNDSPLNKKLGRVGMTYKQYVEKLDGEKKEKKVREVKDIPENLSDLKFTKTESGRFVADYKVKDTTVRVYKNKNAEGRNEFDVYAYTKGDKKSYKNLDSDQLSFHLKMINEPSLTEEGEKMSEKMPLTPEELDAKWGDTGFTFTFRKDNLNIVVKIRTDSDKKDPRLNLYVIDTVSKKRRSFTNLDLAQVHKELLKYDLNSDIDQNLTTEQRKIYEETLLKEKYGDNYLGQLQFSNLQWNGAAGKPQTSYLDKGNKHLKIERIKGNYNLIVTQGKPFQMERKLSLSADEVKEFLGKFDENYKIKSPIVEKEEHHIEGLEDAKFSTYSDAYFKDKKGYITRYRLKNDNSVTVMVFNPKRQMIAMKNVSQDKVKDLIDEYSLDNKAEYAVDTFQSTSQLQPDFSEENLKTYPKAQEIVESYGDPTDLKFLAEANTVDFISDKDEAKYENYFKEHFLEKNTYSPSSIKNRRKLYTWLNNGSAEKFLDSLPQSKKEGMTKEKIMSDLKKTYFGKDYKNNNYGGRLDKENMFSIKHTILEKYY